MAKKQAAAKAKTRIPVAVIGVGGMGGGHCRQITDKVRELKLVAICDIDPATAERVGKEYGVPHFLNHKDLIKAGLCDAVTIATPHPSHSPIAVDCMNAGLHVLTEKPISETVSGAEKMIRAAKKNNVTFAVMFQRRFEPAVSKAIQIVKTGKIGRVLRATLISPEYRSQAYYDSGTWRATWNGEGGGVMMNQSPHIIDVFIQLAGMPKSVRGKAETRLHNIEVEDFAEATMTFKEGGSGYFYCSTNEPGPGQMIEIFGDKGKLLFRNGTLQLFQYKKSISDFTRDSKAMWGGPEQKEVTLKLSTRPSGHFSVLKNFARHLLKGEPLVSPGEEGLASVELANAILLSSMTGKEVKLPISRKAYDDLLAKLRKSSKSKKQTTTVLRTIDPAHKV